MSEPVRVCHLIWSLMRGGAERQAVELAVGLHGPEFAVSLDCLTESGPLAADLAAAGVPMRCWNKRPGLDLLLPFRLAGRLRRERVQILHAHMFTAALWGRLAAKLAGVPAVVDHEHSTHTLDQPKRTRLDRLLLPWTGRLVAVSGNLEARFRQAGYPERKLTVIRNGIRLEGLARPEGDSARAEARKSLGLAADDTVLAVVGMLEPRKDHVTLLAALPEVARARGRVTLLAAGDGPLRAELSEQAAGLPAGAQVRFLGDLPNVRPVLWAADVYVSSSITEGTSLALLEALAAGTPVVATAVGGTPEVLEGDQCGLLCPPSDPVRLAETICACLADPAGTAARVLAGRRRVEAEYSRQTMLDRFAGLYRELLAQRRT